MKYQKVQHKIVKRQKVRIDQKGFTLMELLISVAILSLLMIATTEIFTRSFSSFRTTRALETNIADTQFLMNLMAKELRTSTVVKPTSPTSSTNTVKFFEYSKQECIQYRFNSGNSTVELARQNTNFSGCNNTTDLTGFTNAGTGTVTGSFAVTPSVQSPKSVGKVTMTAIVTTDSLQPIAIQITTSLRDYGYIGL